MNYLTEMTDDELDMELALLEEREKMYDTDAGKRVVVGEMLKIITMLEKCGYQLKDAERTAMAKIWTNKLRDQVIRLGFTAVQKAVVKWVEDDDSEYRVFPKAAWIYDKCSEIKGDPRVEKSIREQKRREALIEEEHRVEMERWKADHPAEWKEVEQRAEMMERRCSQK